MSSEVESRKVETFVNVYLKDNGYSADGYEDRRFKVSVGPIVFDFPNPGRLRYHDLHHVVSGYGSGLRGEAQVSAYELRGGCPTFLISFLCLGSIAIGAVLSPRRVLQAWQKAGGTHTLYSSKIPFRELMQMDIEELRRSLNVPANGFEQRKIGEE